MPSTLNFRPRFDEAEDVPSIHALSPYFTGCASDSPTDRGDAGHEGEAFLID
jgi:hypothetical protein